MFFRQITLICCRLSAFSFVSCAKKGLSDFLFSALCIFMFQICNPSGVTSHPYGHTLYSQVPSLSPNRVFVDYVNVTSIPFQSFKVCTTCKPLDYFRTIFQAANFPCGRLVLFTIYPSPKFNITGFRPCTEVQPEIYFLGVFSLTVCAAHPYGFLADFTKTHRTVCAGTKIHPYGVYIQTTF